MLPFLHPVVFGTLKRRYQRFFMEVGLNDSSQTSVLAHTPNTGSMQGLLAEGNKVMLTHHPDEKRKLAYTAQAIFADGTWVGINTHLPNGLIKQALIAKHFPDLAPYQTIRSEVKYGPNLRSRIDLLLSDHVGGAPPLYLEIKNVTLKYEGTARFPDAVSTRAQKHLDDLCHVIGEGHRAALFFVIQRTDCEAFRPAHHIDPLYGEKLIDAHKQGLNIRCLTAHIDASGLKLTKAIPFFTS